MRYSEAYVRQLEQGPFPAQVDPWAESGRYFQQIHAGMIGQMLEVLHIPLMQRGYLAARETSLLIAERIEPDVNIYRQNAHSDSSLRWNYEEVAEALEVEPGLVVEAEEIRQDAVFIKEADPPRLVTVIEFVSPSNKASPDEIQMYIARRDNLVHRQGVNVVEIDLTRSVKRLLQRPVVAAHAYHIALYLPFQSPRVIGLKYSEPLKRFALPLRAEALPVALQSLYQTAYRQASIAAQIEHEARYNADDMPFPSLLTEVQKQEALQTVQDWLKTLDDLRQT